MREQTIASVLKHKIVAILRGVDPDRCMETAQALYDGGIRLLEVAYDQCHPGSWAATARIIGGLAERFEGKLLVGAGTVTNLELVRLTRDAGGRYVISPNTSQEIIVRTRELGLVSMPGAVTPSEILSAHNAGADFVKIFPAGILGPTYVKAIRAPLNHVKMLAVGGIDEGNIPGFLRAGVVGFGIGGSLTNRRWIEDRAFEKLTDTARRTVAALDRQD